MVPSTEEFLRNLRWAMGRLASCRPILDSDRGALAPLAEAARVEVSAYAPAEFWEVFADPRAVSVIERVLDRAKADSYPWKPGNSSRSAAEELSADLSAL